MKRRRNTKKQAEIKFDILEVTHPNAAGIDVGASEMWVAVPPHLCSEPVQSFGTFTADLHQIADWLVSCGVDTIAIESTGVYWIPLFEVLESRGLEVYLVNARYVKNVPGRKTDVQDCQWLQKLHTYGLLSASFRPVAEIVELRGLVKHHENLIRYRASHIQHLQKTLNLMNLKLTNVITDITGVTGMQIIRAIVNGERNPKKLASFRDHRCKNSVEVIAKSLDGHYKPDQLFVLKQALNLYDSYTDLIEECDREIVKCYSQFEIKIDAAKSPLPERKVQYKYRNDEPLRRDLYEILGVDLTPLPGLQVQSILEILSVIGRDMSKWKTAKHFTAWLSLAPKRDISGGKILKERTLKTGNRAAVILRQAAVNAGRTDTSLGAFYRRLSARSGKSVAVVAVARKLAEIIYIMLRDQVPYQESTAGQYEIKHKERTIRRLKKRAKSLGYVMVKQAA